MRRSLRQAGALSGAFIIGTITLVMVDHREAKAANGWGCCTGDINKRVANNDDPPTKSGYMTRSIRENIGVLRPSPQIKEFPTLLNIDNILGRNAGAGILWRDAAVKCVFWGDESSPSISGGVPKIKAEWKRCVAEAVSSMHDHIFSGGVSRISPYRPESPEMQTSIGIALPQLGELNSENESSLACNHCIPNQVGLSLARYPQPSGGPSQRESEIRNGNSSGSGNSHPIIIKGFADLPENDRRNVVSGAILLVGIGIVLAYVAIDLTKP
jgi:hypothetical protein